MFNIAVKKKRGVELNTLVVFNEDYHDQCIKSNDRSLVSELELMYVVNADTFRDGKFVSVVPVILDQFDSYQTHGYNARRKKNCRVITLLKADIEPHLSSVSELIHDRCYNTKVWRCIRQVKNKYKDVIAQYKGVEPIDEWPWGDK